VAVYQNKTFRLQNRRYLGNKYKLLDFIGEVVRKNCAGYKSFTDIFAGTGVVGQAFSQTGVKVIANDFLFSNFVCLHTFLAVKKINLSALDKKITYLNHLVAKEDNYFSVNFGSRYFTVSNARKIGYIRENIDTISDSLDEKYALITSLLYATDKVANTVGHYDAYRETLDTTQKVKLLLPDINVRSNSGNEVYCDDANKLIKKIKTDILYIDPPYNSRQYSDSYHLLENLAVWKKPPVFGKAKKMDRSGIKSAYCLGNAAEVFQDLVSKADCKYILVSYNNTGLTKDDRSNARIPDKSILEILSQKGKAAVFEKRFKAFTTGKSVTANHYERLYFCAVK
jgi:adenine-specific DNA-methyltransferase